MNDILQLFDDASISEIIRDLVAISAAFGLVIEVSPIKINPLSVVFAWIGKKLNADTVAKFEALSKQIDSLSERTAKKEIDDLRWNILNFANTCRNHVRHTKEEFNHVIAAHDEYETILKQMGKTNGQIDMDFKFIMDVYYDCLKNNSFL